ncbi:MAG: hypothetical protein Q7U75_18810, partial [Desulfobacterales bacterium]|nr:hypothetical protein [Desulfobacterales bacterium]
SRKYSRPKIFTFQPVIVCPDQPANLSACIWMSVFIIGSFGSGEITFRRDAKSGGAQDTIAIIRMTPLPLL